MYFFCFYIILIRRSDKHSFTIYSKPIERLGIKSMQIIDPNGYLLCIIELNKPITYDQLSIIK